MAMVSGFFTKNLNLQKKKKGVGGMAWVSEFFYKASKSKKKRNKNIFFVFCVGGRGGGGW